MKAVLSFISLFTGCFMFSMCSKSIDIDTEINNHITHHIEQQEASLLLLKHVYLDNSQYILDLTLEESMKLGISENSYQNALNDIININAEIQKCLSMPNHEIILTDFQEILSPDTKSCPHPQSNIYYGELRGQICTCNIGTSDTKSVFAPSNINHIRFQCMAKSALITSITCGVYSSGQWVYRSHIGSSIININLDVPILASNCYITLNVATMDSNGVWANFYGINKSLD